MQAQSKPILKRNFGHNSYLINDLVRFILILSHVGSLAMTVEALDHHHGGHSRVGDG